MRESFINELPSGLPPGKKVLIVGPESQFGLNTIKQTIHSLDRGGKWIRAEFRNEPRDSMITEDIGIVLTMNATKTGVLVKVRESARKNNILCPNTAVTTGELKKALERLDPNKGKAASKVDDPNGQVHEPEELAPEPVAQSAPSSVPKPGAPVEVVANSQVSQSGNEYLEAANRVLKALDKLRENVDTTQMAILELTDAPKGESKRVAELEDILRKKDAKISELEDQLETARNLARESEKLHAELKQERNLRLLEATKVATLQGRLNIAEDKLARFTKILKD